MTSHEHWFHIWCGNGESWRTPLAEHLWALSQYGYDGPFHVGIVGPPEARAEVREELHWTRKPSVVVVADEGWEQVTIHRLHQRAKLKRAPDVIFYAHTKGARDDTQLNAMWRRSMDYHLFHGWQAHVELLGELDLDAVGCHWLHPDIWGDRPDAPLPCFGGNFWAATSTYLRTLPVCATGSRHDAEGWIGQGQPRVLDLRPGWPGDFPPVRYGRLQAGR